MRTGTLRHRIIIEKPAATAESTMGQPVPQWGLVGEVWADVEPVSGNERFVSQQLLSDVSHTIRIRYRDDVDATCRAVWGTRIFTFSAVINLRERGRELVITAREEVPARA